MSDWIGAILLVVIFVYLFKVLQLIEKSQEVIDLATNSLGVITSSQMSDEEKESALQKNAGKLFGFFLILAGGGAIALLIPIGLLWLLERFGWLSLASVLATTISPLFLILSTVAVIAFLMFNPNQSDDSEESYSSLDKTLHRLAFNTSTAQIALGDLEETMIGKKLADYQTEKPVFITALPRAGTTLVLECFARIPEFASHCYRDMPFVLIPYLWERFSKSFQMTGESKERAHGDGMKISTDSPEALEEVLWQAFWGKHYHKDRIILWSSKEKNAEFDDFFRSHMAKIAFLRRRNGTQTIRYVSKNNANISRIPILKKFFPESIIIIPFRNPLHHCASLLQQHNNFLKIHADDPFASEYMRAIGHYDFGENLRPIDFDSWYDRRQTQETTSLSFWLEYWVASYQHLLKSQQEYELNFFDYDALCQNPQQGLEILAQVSETNDPQALIANASNIGAPRAKNIDTSGISDALLQEVNRLYEALKNISVN